MKKVAKKRGTSGKLRPWWQVEPPVDWFERSSIHCQLLQVRFHLIVRGEYISVLD
jgi:hypothetical protein